MFSRARRLREAAEWQREAADRSAASRDVTAPAWRRVQLQEDAAKDYALARVAVTNLRPMGVTT